MSFGRPGIRKTMKHRMAPSASMMNPIRSQVRSPGVEVVARASNGQETVKLWNEHRPDVTLLDLRMPELNGVGVIREVRDLDVSARVIVHTTYDTDEEIYQAIRAHDRERAQAAMHEHLRHAEQRQASEGHSSFNAQLSTARAAAES